MIQIQLHPPYYSVMPVKLDWEHGLRQDSNGSEQAVAMASRALTDTEKRYSNIERETLAVVFGLEKFEYYLLGRKFVVETDHSPLEQIFKKKHC